MNARLRPWLIFAVALAGCDPIFTTQYRQPVANLTPDQCIEAALRSSPEIRVVKRDERPEGKGVTSSYHIVVRDSVELSAGAAREERGDSTWVRVWYEYGGPATPPRRDRARWEGEIYEILEGVRARCAPDVPSQITCKSKAGGGFFGQAGACSTRSP